ncbi:MAG TPA: winged helix-turn-helix domain-containing protein [Candidatus Acidoferrales bacterium]|nr:winged helix-turn-helix domain-containing protein [Candidatus Acidoferrales bacterium]
MLREATIYRFGPYELRLRTRELYNRGTKLKLRPQPFEVLKILVEHAGDVVTREELHRQLWSAETFVDFEQGLNTSIKLLRGVLNDSANEPRYIETIPKVGYRMIVSVEAEQTPPVGEAVAAHPTTIEESFAGKDVAPDHASLARYVRRWAVLLVASIVLIGGLAGYVKWSRLRERPQPATGRLMLAVLPFENLTGDAGQDYFSDGLTEEMIAQLGRLDPDHLGVIARTSVMHYKHGDEPLGQIGRELGVQYVLEGSVRRDADKVRITAQLIQVKDQTHLWSRQYDRELSHLLTLQGEIAQETAGEIQRTLGNDHKQTVSDLADRPALSPNAYQAYDLYLRGRYFWNKRTRQDFQQAIDYFQQAIAKDPNYAPAYSGLADSYGLMSGYDTSLPASEVMPKARAAAMKAMQLDGGLAEAHTSLAVIAQNDWDWQTAENEYRRAIQLDPNYATAHHWYAEFLGFEGRFDEAFAEMGRARQLDPLSLIVASDNGAILFYSRQYDAAIEQFRGVLSMDPNFRRAHIVIYAYVQKGMFPDAIADIQKWRPIDDVAWHWALKAYVYGRSGQPAQARRALQQLEQLNRRRQVDPATLVAAYIGMGNKDEAFAWLHKSYVEHSFSLTALKVDPLYDPLRSDPRFQALLRSVGLTP